MDPQHVFDEEQFGAAIARKLAVPLLLTNQAAAAYLGLSETGWERAKAAGDPHFPKPRKVPGRTECMYHRRDIEAFADKLEKDRSGLPGRRGRAAE